MAIIATFTREPRAGAVVKTQQHGWIVVESSKQTETYDEDLGTEDLWTVTARPATEEEVSRAQDSSPKKCRELQRELKKIFSETGTPHEGAWPHGEVLKYNEFDRMEARITADSIYLCGYPDDLPARSLPLTPGLEARVREAFAAKASR